MDPKSIDFSQPISVLLKDTTRQVHGNVENSPGARALVNGTLSRDGYIKYMFMLWHLYDALESALDQHSLQPTLAPSYNPAILRRCDAISSDISHLLSSPPSFLTSPKEWQTHPLYTSTFVPSLPTSLSQYTARLRALSHSSDPTPLLAHSYVRYLGDLSGGQCIRRVLKRTYGLQDNSMSFYEFRKLGGEVGEAGVGDMRKLKEWFKAVMDEGVGDDVTKKRKIVEEVQLAFRFNGALLDALVPNSPNTIVLPHHPHPHSSYGAIKRSRPSPLTILGWLLSFSFVGVAFSFIFCWTFVGDCWMANRAVPVHSFQFNHLFMAVVRSLTALESF